MNRLLLPVLAFALAGCAQAFEGRVAAKLHDAGIPRSMAQCMAHRWVDRLSLFQLRRIEQLSDEFGERYRNRRLTVFDLLNLVQQLDDPEIVKVVSRSVGACALRL